MLASKAISDHSELWEHYFSDFIQYRLKLETPGTSKGIAQMILDAFFKDLHSEDVDNKMVLLYTCTHVYQLDLAKFAGILRPLNNIQNVSLNNYTLNQ